MLVLSVAIFLLGVPSSLSFGPLAEISILNYNLFDFVCMLTDNIFLPLGGIFMCYYIGWKWTPELLVEEINHSGKPFPLAKPWLFLIRFVVPVMVIIVSLTGFLSIYHTVST